MSKPKHVIEKGIPTPPKANRSRGPEPGSVRDTLGRMEVGDSVFFPGRTPADLSSFMACAKRDHPDYKYTSRTVDGGVRVWRIA